MPSSASPPPFVFTRSLHDALPILVVIPILIPLLAAALSIVSWRSVSLQRWIAIIATGALLLVSIALLQLTREHGFVVMHMGDWAARSEEHTSELQSRGHLVCRLLLRLPRLSSLVPYTTLFRSWLSFPY